MNSFTLKRMSPVQLSGIAASILIAVGVLAGCTSQPPPKPTVSSQKPVEPPPPVPAQPVVAAKTVAPTHPSPVAEGEWEDLFDGRSLTGWRVADFAGKGDVKVEGGRIVLGSGYMTGITRTSPVPRMNYEVSLEAMRVEGSDFFCGLTFPVGADPCTLIVGGWGGGLVGLSSLDGNDAANNETTKFLSFENGRWYRVRLQVRPKSIRGWIDDDKVVDVDTTDRKISIRWEVEESKPFGVATWSTSAALRNIRVRQLD
jgi:hypothetical protein